jgi:hypothetical protein
MSLFDELASEARDVTSVPNDQSMASLRDKCQELVDKERQVKKLETDLEDAKKELTTLRHKDLPDIFNQIGTTSFTLKAQGDSPAVECELRPYFKASIPAEWPDEDKSRAFDHLEQLNGGDIVKTTVSFTLGKGQLDLARSMVAMLRLLGERMMEEGASDIPAASITMGVPWNSLTSWIKERHAYESGEQFAELEDQPTMDLQVLNATVGEMVKIKEIKA